MKSSYHKYVERNYKSGGSGSNGTHNSGGGHSMENMVYVKKNQFYPRTKLNVSDMTEQENMHSINEDKESVFHSGNVSLYSKIIILGPKYKHKCEQETYREQKFSRPAYSEYG